MSINELDKYNFVGSVLKEIIVMDDYIKLIIDFYNWMEEDCFGRLDKEARKLTLTFPHAICNMESCKFRHNDILSVSYEIQDNIIKMFMAYYSEFMDDFDEMEIQGEEVICEFDNNYV